MLRGRNWKIIFFKKICNNEYISPPKGKKILELEIYIYYKLL